MHGHFGPGLMPLHINIIGLSLIPYLFGLSSFGKAIIRTNINLVDSHGRYDFLLVNCSSDFSQLPRVLQPRIQWPGRVQLFIKLGKIYSSNKTTVNMTQEKKILKEQSKVLMRIEILVPEDRKKHSFPCIVFPCTVFVLLLPAAYIRTYVHSRMAKCLQMEKT